MKSIGSINNAFCKMWGHASFTFVKVCSEDPVQFKLVNGRFVSSSVADKS